MAELTPNPAPKGKCGDCRFAVTYVHAGATRKEQTLIACHRYPPQRLGGRAPYGGHWPTPQQEADTGWPFLTWDDWCGEWQARIPIDDLPPADED